MERKGKERKRLQREREKPRSELVPVKEIFKNSLIIHKEKNRIVTVACV